MYTKNCRIPHGFDVRGQILRCAQDDTTPSPQKLYPPLLLPAPLAKIITAPTTHPQGQIRSPNNRISVETANNARLSAMGKTRGNLYQKANMTLTYARLKTNAAFLPPSE